MSPRRGSSSGFDTRRLEGALWLPDVLEKAAQGQANGQAPEDYHVPRGFTLQEEIGRVFRIAQAQWKVFSATLERTDLNATLSSRAFVEEFLRDGLRIGVEAALVTLGEGFLKHAANEPLRRALIEGRIERQAYFEELLRLVYRFIFLFAVEERGVLERTYTAHDLKPWAEALGYDGPPFPFDPDRRAQLRAELDAYYARLYGLTREDLCYILDPASVMAADYPSETFRVLKQNEMRAFGEYRTQRLVLDAWDRLQNGELH